MKPARPMTPGELAYMANSSKFSPNQRAWAKRLLESRPQDPNAAPVEPASAPEATPARVEPPKELQDPWRALNEVPALGRCVDCRYPFQKRNERRPFHADADRSGIVQVCQSCATKRYIVSHLTQSP